MVNTELVEALARSLGMPFSGWDGTGSIHFDFSGRGKIVFEIAGETLLIYLISSLRPAHNPQVADRSLRFCGNESSLPFPVHCALTPEGALVFAIRLDPMRQSLPELERALECLLEFEHHIV